MIILLHLISKDLIQVILALIYYNNFPGRFYHHSKELMFVNYLAIKSMTCNGLVATVTTNIEAGGPKVTSRQPNISTNVMMKLLLCVNSVFSVNIDAKYFGKGQVNGK